MRWIDVASEMEAGHSNGLEVEVAGIALLLRRIDGGIFALSATCPHHAAWLSQGRFGDGRVFCPRHGGVFDLATGRRIAGPFCPDLPVYPVRIVGGRVEVAL
ncbi:Rieske (2Fe-2S) protein [Acidiphilium sp.]|uniref:Rieske (2Fe-2S) protein n=1 Tax=Acidiphilium sp. TaxID=527 RepID=UPI003D05AF12